MSARVAGVLAHLLITVLLPLLVAVGWAVFRTTMPPKADTRNAEVLNSVEVLNNVEVSNNPVASPVPTVIDSAELFSGVNAYRTERGLQALKENALLCTFAETRAKEVVTDWSHAKIVARWARGEWYPFANMGENLAKEYSSASAAVRAWHLSPTHQEIMAGNFFWGCVRCHQNHCALIVGGN